MWVMATQNTDDITCSHSVVYNPPSHMQICRNCGNTAWPSLVSVLGAENKVVDFLQTKWQENVFSPGT